MDREDELIEALERIGEIRPQDCRRWVQEAFGAEAMADGYERVYQRALAID